MGLIDGSEQVNFRQYKENQSEYIDAAMDNRGKTKVLWHKINQLTRLNGEMAEVSRQIKVMETAKPTQILKNHRDRKKQINIAAEILQKSEYVLKQLDNTLSNIKLNSFDAPASTGDPKIDAVLQPGFVEWGSRLNLVENAVSQLTEWFMKWQKDMGEQGFVEEVLSDMEEYQQNQERFRNAGMELDDFPELLERQARIQKEVQEIDIHKRSLMQLKDRYTNQIIDAANTNRKRLSERRRSFLQELMKNNQFVQISLRPFGQPWSEAEVELRKILRAETGFYRDFNIIKNIYNSQDEDRFDRIKEYIIDLWEGREQVKDIDFLIHLKSKMMKNGVYVGLHLWYPEDRLETTFGTQKDLNHGSPGEKAAALLSFIFSHGSDPLLLDQPEDDLDNKVIQKLVKTGIVEKKRIRQIIIVTHNANIVVNGNSEMVFPLRVSNGETSTDAKSLQNEHIRTNICDIMEGGKRAFEQRYKRILLEAQ